VLLAIVVMTLTLSYNVKSTFLFVLYVKFVDTPSDNAVWPHWSCDMFGNGQLYSRQHIHCQLSR